MGLLEQMYKDAKGCLTTVIVLGVLFTLFLLDQAPEALLLVIAFIVFGIFAIRNLGRGPRTSSRVPSRTEETVASAIRPSPSEGLDAMLEKAVDKGDWSHARTYAGAIGMSEIAYRGLVQRRHTEYELLKHWRDSSEDVDAQEFFNCYLYLLDRLDPSGWSTWVTNANEEYAAFRERKPSFVWMKYVDLVSRVFDTYPPSPDWAAWDKYVRDVLDSDYPRKIIPYLEKRISDGMTPGEDRNLKLWLAQAYERDGRHSRAREILSEETWDNMREKRAPIGEHLMETYSGNVDTVAEIRKIMEL